MKVLIFLTLFLAGCTPSIDSYQQTLDAYSESAFRGELETSLTGAALYQASQSRAVVFELGWTQVGKSRFEETRLLDSNKVSSCLDVSEVGFLDSSGVAISLERKVDRILMEIEFSKSNPPLVASMKEVGQC
jgi:hypothetical protein